MLQATCMLPLSHWAHTAAEAARALAKCFHALSLLAERPAGAEAEPVLQDGPPSDVFSRLSALPGQDRDHEREWQAREQAQPRRQPEAPLLMDEDGPPAHTGALLSYQREFVLFVGRCSCICVTWLESLSHLHRECGVLSQSWAAAAACSSCQALVQGRF